MYPPSEPGYTCPLIDKALEMLEDADTTLSNISSEDPDVADLVSQIESILSDIPSKLEDIRTNAEKLRAWGSHYVDRADKLEGDMSSAESAWESEREDLKDEIDDLRREVNDLRRQLGDK